MLAMARGASLHRAVIAERIKGSESFTTHFTKAFLQDHSERQKILPKL
jgi:hypothetical protein